MVKIEINGVREVVAKDKTGTLAVLSSGDVMADIRSMIGLAENREWEYTLDKSVERCIIPPAYRETMALALDTRPDCGFRTMHVDYALDTGFEVTIEEVRAYYAGGESFEDIKQLAEQLGRREGVECRVNGRALCAAVADELLSTESEYTDELVNQAIERVLTPEQQRLVDAESVIQVLTEIRKFGTSV